MNVQQNSVKKWGRYSGDKQSIYLLHEASVGRRSSTLSAFHSCCLLFCCAHFRCFLRTFLLGWRLRTIRGSVHLASTFSACSGGVQLEDELFADSLKNNAEHYNMHSPRAHVIMPIYVVKRRVLGIVKIRVLHDSRRVLMRLAEKSFHVWWQ